MPAGKGEKRVISQEEKLRAIQRVHNGESKASVARDIGVPESTLRGWCKGEEKIKNDYNNSVNKVNRSIKFEPKEKKSKPHHALQPYISRPSTGGAPPASPSDLPAGLSTTELNELERAKLEELEILLKIPPATAAVFRAQMAVQNQFKLGDSGDSGTNLAAFPLGAMAPKIALDPLNTDNMFAASSPLLSANLSTLRQQLLQFSNITNMLTNNNNGTSYSTPQNSYKSSKPKSHQRFSPTYSKSPKKSSYANGLLMPSVFPSNLTSPKSNGQFSHHDLLSKSADLSNFNPNHLLASQPISKALSIDCGSSSIAGCPMKTEFLPPQLRLPSPNVSNVVIKIEQSTTTPPQTTETDPILFNRLTSTGNEDCVAQDLSVSGNKESPGSVLNDNNDDNIDENRENTMSRNEGIHHGQQFLDWLSTCQDEPQITQQNVDYVANMLTKLQNYKKPNTFIKRRRK